MKVGRTFWVRSASRVEIGTARRQDGQPRPVTRIARARRATRTRAGRTETSTKTTARVEHYGDARPDFNPRARYRQHAKIDAVRPVVSSRTPSSPRDAILASERTARSGREARRPAYRACSRTFPPRAIPRMPTRMNPSEASRSPRSPPTLRRQTDPRPKCRTPVSAFPIPRIAEQAAPRQRPLRAHERRVRQPRGSKGVPPRYPVQEEPRHHRHVRSQREALETRRGALEHPTRTGRTTETPSTRSLAAASRSPRTASPSPWISTKRSARRLEANATRGRRARREESRERRHRRDRLPRGRVPRSTASFTPTGTTSRDITRVITRGRSNSRNSRARA